MKAIIMANGTFVNVEFKVDEMEWNYNAMNETYFVCVCADTIIINVRTQC